MLHRCVTQICVFTLQEQKNTLRNVTKRQTGDERVKEELFRDLSTARDVQNSEHTSEGEQQMNSVDLTKGLELPWAWVHQFAAVPQSEKSYNFVENDTTPTDGTPHLLTDGSFDFCTGHFVDNASDYDDPTLSLTGKTDETDEKFGIIMGLVDDLMKEIGNAIGKGNCDIKNMKSICSVMSGKRTDGKKDQIEAIVEALQNTDESEAQFENVDELGKYLKLKCSIEPLSKKLLECDMPMDENIVTKAVPDDMILGLVEPNATAFAASESKTDDHQLSPLSVTSEERRENIRMVDGFITDAIDEIPDSDVESDEKCLPPTFNCDMPALPGIGPACSPKTMDAFLVYILSQARAEKGMVYPRFLKEPNCPVMINSLN